MIRMSIESIRQAVGGVWLQEPLDPEAQVHGVSTDTRAMMGGSLFVALAGERFDAHDHLPDAVNGGAVALLVDRTQLRAKHPGSIGVIGVDDTRRALSLLAHAWRAQLNATVIAITGSCGKTTTRRLMEAVLRGHGMTHASTKSFNNDIGVPLTVLGACREDQFLLLELGTSAPGEIAQLSSIARPDLALFTNVAPAHLAGLGTLAEVAREKASLAGCVTRTGTIVAPIDDDVLATAIDAVAPPSTTRRSFGDCDSGADSALCERRVLSAMGEQALVLEDGLELRLQLPGAFNARNACAVVVAARALGISDAVIVEGLASVAPCSMRFMPKMIDAEGTLLLNDAYNANPAAMSAAIGSFLELATDARRRILILGDMLELGDQEASFHAALGAEIAGLTWGDEARPVELVVLVGRAMANTAQALGVHQLEQMIVRVPQLDTHSIEAIAGLVEPGDAVLVKGSRGVALEQVAQAIEGLAVSRASIAAATHV